MTTSASAARRREDLAAWFIFATLLAMAAALVAALVVEEQPHEDVVEDGASRRVYRGHGFVHPKFAVTRDESGNAQPPSMLAGGDGRARHQRVVVQAGLFMLLGVVFGIASIYLASLRTAGPSPLKRPMLLVGLLGCIVVAAMFLSYWRTLGDDDPAYFLGFPAPAAWMIYGVWLFPVLVVVCFVYWFDRWYAPPQINEKFQQIMAARNREGGNG